MSLVRPSITSGVVMSVETVTSASANGGPARRSDNRTVRALRMIFSSGVGGSGSHRARDRAPAQESFRGEELLHFSSPCTRLTPPSTARNSMMSASCDVAPSSLNLRADTSTRDSNEAIAAL